MAGRRRPARPWPAWHPPGRLPTESPSPSATWKPPFGCPPLLLRSAFPSSVAPPPSRPCLENFPPIFPPLCLLLFALFRLLLSSFLLLCSFSAPSPFLFHSFPPFFVCLSGYVPRRSCARLGRPGGDFARAYSPFLSLVSGLKAPKPVSNTEEGVQWQTSRGLDLCCLSSVLFSSPGPCPLGPHRGPVVAEPGPC